MLTLVRGIPGSGKSTLAKKLAQQEHANHFEADMFFVREGEYKFDPKKLQEAHNWCRMQALASLLIKRPAIVSNTFLASWEIEPYIGIAFQADVPIRIIECTDEYGSIHNVPEDKIQQMRSRFIKNTHLAEIFRDNTIDFRHAKEFA